MLSEELIEQIKQSFMCPITYEMMSDPVVCADGFTYERSAIEAWLARSLVSPMTGARLSSRALVPNHALYCMIDAFGAAFEAAHGAAELQGTFSALSLQEPRSSIDKLAKIAKLQSLIGNVDLTNFNAENAFMLMHAFLENESDRVGVLVCMGMPEEPANRIVHSLFGTAGAGSE